VGVMPSDKIAGDPEPGDRIIALGGRTGRDGIHGATFSSAELTDTHADEFAHAVQIGNAIEEKRVLDAILRARDHVAGEGSGNRHRASGEDGDAGPLFNAITDCGAGGFSSAVGEMGEKLGAEVHLERAPLKYDGLSYTEIWISEAQERMVLAVPPRNLEALKRICAEEHVELADLGHFGTPSGAQGPELILNYGGTEVGRLPMSFLHDGIPTPIREAVWRGLGTGHSGLSGGGEGRGGDGAAEPTTREALLRLLAHPNIASKHEIIRQYDHEVQGNTVVKPLGGPLQRGPMDAAVIEPVPGSGRGIAIGCGLATNVGDPQRGGDPYEMALAAIDECVRNLVCVGADPERIAILDNFCWPSCRKPENLASLVRAAEGCYDGAKAYRTPFVSGKDSLNNQFTTEDGRTIEIPPTLLITGVGIVEDLERVVTMAAKRAGNTLAFVGRRPTTLRASHFGTLFGDRGELRTADLDADPRTAATIATLVAGGHVAAAHDVSDGGVLCAIAEMLIGSDGTLGASVDLSGLHDDPLVAAFGEGSGGYVLELDGAGLEAAERACGGALSVVGSLDGSGSLAVGGETVGVGALAEAWLGTVKV
ncbi:MAG: AIR synthase-related protein, partial [Planctomycetota bacterium]